jgi:hypothetical protein
MNGQNVSKLASADQEALFQGALVKDQVIQQTFNISTLSNGMYLIRSEYSSCGSDRSGKGNQVFKLAVVDEKEIKKTQKRIEKQSSGDFHLEKKIMSKPIQMK